MLNGYRADMVTPEPMSDRRMIALVLSVLAAVAGVLVTVFAAISLQDPFAVTGELGTRVEIGRELIAAFVAGVLLIAAGCGVATGLVRAQLRGTHR